MERVLRKAQVAAGLVPEVSEVVEGQVEVMGDIAPPPPPPPMVLMGAPPPLTIRIPPRVVPPPVVPPPIVQPVIPLPAPGESVIPEVEEAIRDQRR